MKKKLKLAFMMAFVLLYTTAQAQNTFFPTRAGIVQLYANKDGKGKTTGYARYTVKSVDGSEGNMTIKYMIEALDKNNKSMNPPMEVACEVLIRDYVVTLDMNQMIAGLMKTPDFSVEISGMPMEVPGNLQPGQTLKDANVSMTVDMVFTKMTTVMKMTDGKCIDIEDVTVKAGTFQCHKITQTVSTTALKRETVTTTISWYAPNIGTIKTETYDNKKKLLSSMELVSMEN